MILVACGGGSSSNSGNGTPLRARAADGDGITQDSSDLNLPTVTIDASDLPSIHSSNAHAFRVSGTCSEEGMEVSIQIGNISPFSQPTCSKGKWSTDDVDVTPLTDNPVTVTADHSNEEGEKAEQASRSLLNDFVCPAGFVAVPFLAGYTSTSFCVAKYEMKRDSATGAAVSEASGIPWTRVFRQSAITKCQEMGSGHDLITNDEWQTLARNIEGVASNWGEGTVGSASGLNQGHSDSVPSQTLAAGQDNDPCFGTEETAACDNTHWHLQRRTHTFSNGEVIWDLAGNVWEMLKDDNSTSYGSESNISQITEVSHSTTHALSGGTTTTSRSAKAQFGPFGDYANIQGLHYGLGYGRINSNQGMVLRGGYWRNIRAGVFTTSLASPSIVLGSNNGFRCTYRPPSSN